MTIFGMGMLELLVILLIVLILFGHKSIPKLGKFFGKTAKDLKDGLRNGKDKAEKEAADEILADEGSDDSGAMTVREQPRD